MIDWQRVHELREEIGADDFGEVVELFLEEVDDVIQRLETTPDPADYEADLHFLKGSALNLGFREFGKICADGEQRSAAGQSDSVEVSAVISSYRSSRDRFLSQLQADNAA